MMRHEKPTEVEKLKLENLQLKDLLVKMQQENNMKDKNEIVKSMSKRLDCQPADINVDFATGIITIIEEGDTR